jgi:hypothetical protein
MVVVDGGVVGVVVVAVGKPQFVGCMNRGP